MNIIINRRKTFIDYFRSYEIIVNGKKIAEMKTKKLSLSIKEMECEVFARIDGFTSNKILLDSDSKISYLTIYNDNFISTLFIMGLIFVVFDYAFDHIAFKFIVVVVFAAILLRYLFFKSSYLKLVESDN